MKRKESWRCVRVGRKRELVVGASVGRQVSSVALSVREKLAERTLVGKRSGDDEARESVLRWREVYENAQGESRCRRARAIPFG